jgi:hypothetical protein
MLLADGIVSIKGKPFSALGSAWARQKGIDRLVAPSPELAVENEISIPLR